MYDVNINWGSGPTVYLHDLMHCTYTMTHNKWVPAQTYRFKLNGQYRALFKSIGTARQIL